MPRVDSASSSLGPVLAEHPFFADLDAERLNVISGCAANVRFNPGEYIFREGDPADRFYIIRFGRISVEVGVPGRGPRPLQTLGEGDVLGWSWLIPPHRWRFDSRAVALVRAIGLDGKCLRAKCDQDHELGYRLLSRFSGVLAKRLEATRLQLMDVYGK